MATRRAVTGPPILSQAAIRNLADLMKLHAQKEDQVKVLAKRIAGEEQAALVILKAGGIVEPGTLQAAIAVTKGQVRPKWADLYVSHLGQAAADKARAETPPGKDTEELVISGVGVTTP